MTIEEIRLAALTLAVDCFNAAINSDVFELLPDTEVTIEEGLVQAASTFERYIANGYNDTSSKS
jgi:hypothetical protein